MNPENFSLDKANELYDANYKDEHHLECKKYILEYFYPITNGDFYIWNGKNFNCISNQNFKNTYLARLPKDIVTWFTKKNTKLYDITANITDPLIKGTKIN